MHCILTLNCLNKIISSSLNIAGHKMDGIAEKRKITDSFACILLTKDGVL